MAEGEFSVPVREKRGEVFRLKKEGTSAHPEKIDQG